MKLPLERVAEFLSSTGEFDPQAVQVTQKGSIPFDDVEVAQRILRESGYDCEAANAAAGRNP